MRLVFIGASTFGLRCLDMCRGLAGIHVTGVVTSPPKFSISYSPQGVTNVLHADFPGYCRSHDLPCVTLERSMKEPGLVAAVHAWQPDAFLVAGWYHMIPRDWRERAPAYGLHASLLPDYSGGAPLVWAMINGETMTGITLFQMDDGVDSGPILGQASEAIHQEDTIRTLYARIEERGLDLIRTHLPKLADGTAHLQTQDESLRRVFPQRKPEDGKISWSMEASAIDRFIRAQTKPYPGAFTIFNTQKLTLWRSSIAPNHHAALAIGEFRSVGDEVIVGCGSHAALQLELVEWQGEDMPAPEWFRRVQPNHASQEPLLFEG